MIVPFDQLPDYAKIWIFQSNKTFSDTQEEQIQSACNTFLPTWQAHGTNLKAGFDVKYRHFLVFGVDQSHQSATGCSVDKLWHFVRQLGDALQVNFFDRDHVILVDESNHLILCHLAQLANFIKPQNLSNWRYFHNVLETKQQLEQNWLRPISGSWVESKLKKLSVAPV